MRSLGYALFNLWEFERRKDFQKSARTYYYHEKGTELKMDEKIIVTGKLNKINIFAILSIVLAVICILISIFVFKTSGSVRYHDDYFLYAFNLTRTPVGISYLFYLSLFFFNVIQ